jgi:hypothetical protein
VTWRDVVVAIPTMPERSALLDELVRRTVRECRGAEIVIWRHSPGGDPRSDFPTLIELALEIDRPLILALEDDVWLAPNFGVQAAIPLQRMAVAPEVGAVSLFSRSSQDMAMLERGERWRSQPPSSFCMMQAVLLRASVMRGFGEWAPAWYEAHPEHRHAADLLLGAWLSRRRAKMLVHVPSLVQHRAVPSTLPGHRGIRQSETYRRVFGPVPGEDR